MQSLFQPILSILLHKLVQINSKSSTVSLPRRTTVDRTLDASVSRDGDATFEGVIVSALSMILVLEWEMVEGAGLQWKSGLTLLLEDNKT